MCFKHHIMKCLHQSTLHPRFMKSGEFCFVSYISPEVQATAHCQIQAFFFFFWKWASARLLRLPGPQNLMQVCAHVLSCWDGHDRKDSMFFLWSPRVYKHNTSVPGAKSHPRWLSHTASPTLPTQELNSVIAFLKEDRGTKIHGKLNSGMAAESK